MAGVATVPGGGAAATATVAAAAAVAGRRCGRGSARLPPGVTRGGDRGRRCGRARVLRLRGGCALAAVRRAVARKVAMVVVVVAAAAAAAAAAGARSRAQRRPAWGEAAVRKLFVCVFACVCVESLVPGAARVCFSLVRVRVAARLTNAFRTYARGPRRGGVAALDDRLGWAREQRRSRPRRACD